MSSESSSNAGSRASNIQKILDRKQKIFQLPRNSKMVKISTYSTCEVEKSENRRPLWVLMVRHLPLQEKDCRCGGFKLNEEQRKRDESNYSPQSKDLCNNQNCAHSFREFATFRSYQTNINWNFSFAVKHVCHLESLTDDALNKLLNNIVSQIYGFNDMSVYILEYRSTWRTFTSAFRGKRI